MKEKNKMITAKPQKKQEKKDAKIPWLFNLEIRDLANPITLRRVHILKFGVVLIVLGLAASYVWENFLRTPTGLELVNEMVEAAGGMEAWNNIKSGQFTRTQRLYDEAGDQLTEKAQTFYFQKINGEVKLMVNSVDKAGNQVWVGQDDKGFWATKAGLPADPQKTSGDLGMMCDSKYCQPTCAAAMAFYRMSMPFKLTDAGVRPDVNDGTVFAILDWNPFEFLNIEPLVLDVSYRPTVGKDKWRFFVDPKDKLIHKIEYYNKSDFGEYRPEEIYWSDHKTVNGITFSHKWLRYWGNGQVMEEYVFSDVDFGNELKDEKFNRPEGHQELSLK